MLCACSGCSGLLQDHGPTRRSENKLDPRIPAESLERLFGAYRDTHQPRMGLRELAAAFRASALDDELIAWARLGDTWQSSFRVGRRGDLALLRRPPGLAGTGS